MYALGMCVDDSYFVPALVVLTSAAGAIPPYDRRHIPVRVLTTNLSRAQADTMAAVTRRLGFHSFDVRWEVTQAHHAIVHGPYISAATYLRFRFTPAFVQRPYLAYLDADLIVLRDISVPFDSLADAEIGLVRDTVNHTIGRGPALPGVVRRWPSLAGLPYFNAGMMWCSTLALAALRGGAEEILRHGREHIHFNDQDALNLWGARSGTVRSVHAAYNSFEMGRFRERGDWIYRMAKRVPQSDPAVVHFVGPEKPWQTTCPTTEAVRVYRSYLGETVRYIRRAGDRCTEPYTRPSSMKKREAKRA